MPHPYRTGGRTLFLCLLLACASSAFAAQHTPLSPYEKAQRMREALEGRPEQQRTRRDYERVLNAYRSIYHSDPASPKADASISAVAELLAEQGDRKSTRLNSSHTVISYAVFCLKKKKKKYKADYPEKKKKNKKNK